MNTYRNEDSLIAWTWKRFMDTNGTDPKVLLRFPMTKVEINKIKQPILDNFRLIYQQQAVVRAMDAIQQFLQQENLAVPQEFVVGGGSKVSTIFDFFNVLQTFVMISYFIAWMDR